jgi:hypothetical protein
MLKSIRFRPVLGVMVALLGVATLALAATVIGNPYGACYLEDDDWATVAVTNPDGTMSSSCQDLAEGGLLWSSSTGGRLHTLSTYSYARTTCENLVEAGFNDWRLPTVKEAKQGFADGAWTHISRTGTYEDGSPSMSRTYWTADRKGNKAYWFDLDTGVATLVPWGSACDCRCVRP